MAMPGMLGSAQKNACELQEFKKAVTGLETMTAHGARAVEASDVGNQQDFNNDGASFS